MGSDDAKGQTINNNTVAEMFDEVRNPGSRAYLDHVRQRLNLRS